MAIKHLEQFVLHNDASNPLQFNGLKYLTAECTYGGKVTDIWDRRTLSELLAGIYTPSIAQPDFSFDGRKTFPLEDSTLSEYKVAICLEILIMFRFILNLSL